MSDVGALPTPMELALPARSESLALVRAAARIVAYQFGGDEDLLRDLTLGVDEVAAVLIEQAPASTSLHLSFDHDGQDLYVRMRAPIDVGGFEPRTPELTLLLLQATTESFDVRRFDDGVVGVLQVRLED